ncbi:hypothetical protein, partial [Mycobacterium kiyosense]|uniref:hypothetical protein n=1 Tax=Mycobacterium kiyosense TaxID=2871094 RepID=UPI00222FE3F4
GDGGVEGLQAGRDVGRSSNRTHVRMLSLFGGSNRSQRGPEAKTVDNTPTVLKSNARHEDT